MADDIADPIRLAFALIVGLLLAVPVCQTAAGFAAQATQDREPRTALLIGFGIMEAAGLLLAAVVSAIAGKVFWKLGIATATVYALLGLAFC